MSRYWALFATLMAIAGAAVISQDSLAAAAGDEEMNWLEAKAAELLGEGFNMEDDEDDQMTMSDDDDEILTNETLVAAVLDDGNIEIEDMVLTPDQFYMLFPSADKAISDDVNELVSLHKRAALSSKSRRWPEATVYYAYSKNLAGSQTKIREAMDIWSRKTCMKFILRTSSQMNYVRFRSKIANSCSSALGYGGKGTQYINLSKNCFSKRTILHEIGHTLGLIHEHQHPDRDTYVTINWSNINPTKKHNFTAKTNVRTFGLVYDPRSVMHYRSTAFRKYGCESPCHTITSKTSISLTKSMGRLSNLSPDSDIPIITKMYCNE